MPTLVQNRPLSPASADLLVKHGGPRTVTVKYRERWGTNWWMDAIRIAKYLRSGVTTQSTSHGAVAKFEADFGTLTGCRYALAMNSGTAALHSAMFAVGVGPGDEVILPSYTWHATASAVLCCGGQPVFCDIDPQTLTANPRDVEARITPRTRAIVVVHIWGNPADLQALREIADRHQIALIEDCSHAHGASYIDKPVGAWGDVGCFSLQGGKAVSAGEGGVAVTNRREYYDRMLALGHPVRAGAENEEWQRKYGHVHLGPKYRPHLLGILLAHSSLARLEELNRLRARNWAALCEGLSGCTGVTPVASLPSAKRGGWLEFKFLLDLDHLRGTREDFVADAKAEGVPVSPDRYRALHELPVLLRGGPLTAASLADTELAVAPSLPVTERVIQSAISVPAFTNVSAVFVRQCAAALRKVAAHRAIDR